MMWLTTALQITLFSQVVRTQSWEHPPLRYVDYSMTNQDFYFDRIVPLTSNVNRNGSGYVNYGIGVLITPDRILTSYNPFRNILRDKTKLSELYSTTIIARTRNETGIWYYTWIVSKLACGRQIQDLPDYLISKGDLWHGTGQKNCPLHDLLVFRIHNSLTVSTVRTEDHNMDQYPDGQYTHRDNDVFLTVLARPQDRMSADFKFCAVVGRMLLRVTKYEEDDNAVVDCDEWLPRDWGYFICILNKNEYSEVSSGAMLVSDEKLFGVASFVLFRGTKSIIVFTDIRPYYKLIYQTCTYSDSEEPRPDSFPPSVEWTTTTTSTSTTTTSKP